MFYGIAFIRVAFPTQALSIRVGVRAAFAQRYYMVEFWRILAK
jgi:hypothetical protein